MRAGRFLWELFEKIREYIIRFFLTSADSSRYRQHPALEAVLEQVERVAPTDPPFSFREKPEPAKN